MFRPPMPGTEGVHLGFAEKIVTPAESCVRFLKLSFTEAAVIEPMGVAYDLFKTTDICVGDDVLVMGIGTIGLLALRLARLAGARKIYAANNSGRDMRDAIAREWGADEIIHTDKTPLTEISFERNGIDKALVTAPPSTLQDVMYCMNYGGVIGLIGITEGNRGAKAEERTPIDMKWFHDKKLQLRASNASPAMCFPACIDLCESGMVDISRLISHELKMETFKADFMKYIDEKTKAVKAVMTKHI